jgi:hypothetical protein
MLSIDSDQLRRSSMFIALMIIFIASSRGATYECPYFAPPELARFG